MSLDCIKRIWKSLGIVRLIHVQCEANFTVTAGEESKKGKLQINKKHRERIFKLGSLYSMEQV